MTLNYELQRLQLNRNLYLIASVRENKHVAEKIYNIERYLKEGADINFVDRNDGDSAPIHIAVLMGEPDIVQFLKNNGANVNLTNLNGETPLVIAQRLNSDKKQTILNILQGTNQTGKNTVQAEISQNVSQNSAQTNKNTTKSKKKTEYIKRIGTAGVSGQLYETKLLTMVLMRALKSHVAKPGEAIEQFYLGTNINGIGDLDDICLRYRVKGHPNDILLFVQAKHRENPEKGKVSVEDMRSATGDFSLRKYFDSYLKIKDKFQIKKTKQTTKGNKDATGNDVMFEGEFSNVECNLILYTPAKDSLEQQSKSYSKEVSKMVDYLIKTQTTKNEVIFQYNYDEEDIEYLTKMTVIERIKKLGLEFLDLVMSKADKSQVILAAELISTYHVVMGRQVLQISKDQTPDDNVNRMWEFRSDFFTSECEYLVTLRNTFCKVLATTRCDQSKIDVRDKNSFDLILERPTASTISKLIGKLVTYDEETKKIQVKDVNEFKEMFKGEFEKARASLNKLTINETVIREATILKLKSMKMKLPNAFGNFDMTISDKKKNRVTTIADKLIDFFKAYKDDNNTVEINEAVVGPGKPLEKGIIESNGGIGSAVGNLLVFDTDTKTMKFDMENRSLPNKAASLLNELKHPRYYPTNRDLCSYRIKMNIGGFPKDSFHGDEYDKRQARDFLSKLWFYTNQEKEGQVEDIIKKGINEYYNQENDQNLFKLRIHTDSIFLRSHYKIQKWWMSIGETPYLTQTSEIFERAKLDVLENPLLNALDYMCNLKIQNFGIEFNQDAIRALELNKNTERIFNVITDANLLSSIKIMQHFETHSLRNKCTFIDFDYVLSLPLNDYNTMLKELKQTKIETLIVIYEKLKYYEGLCNKLKEVIKLFKGSKVVVVTERILANEIKTYTGDKYLSVKDGKTYLIDLLESSQEKILEESTIVFQGEELPVKSVLDQRARNLVRTEILNKLLDREKIEIGYPLMDLTYKQVEQFRDRSINDTPVNTLYDMDDQVVTVAGRPGQGKSALLTHLSLNTKKLDPLPWIVRVNLQNHTKEFKRWQDQNLTIDVPLVLQFLCTIALKNNDGRIKIELNHFEGEVTVGHVDENINPLMLFELEWFLYLYNSGQVIFLFDNFNAMNPHYEKEVLQILKLLRNEKKRMWITTCPYKHTRLSLEKEFGTSYELDLYSTTEINAIIDRFFRTNLSLEQLNYDQFENIRSLLESTNNYYSLVKDPERELVPIFSLTFQLIYTIAVAFFQSEINRASPLTAKQKIKENFRIDLDQYTPIDEMLGRAPDDNELELAGTPIHIYIAANYFKACLQDISILLSEEEARDKWHVILNTIKLYQHCIKTQMKTIFSQEDIDDESIRAICVDIRRDFFDQHKKLGLFTICKEENDLTKLLKPDEISKVKKTISRIERGEVQDSLVDCVVDGVPRIAHLILAEYFAVECLTDILKSLAENSEANMLNPLKCAPLWQSILNIVLFNSPPGVRQRFDYKLQSDSSLAEVANSKLCRNVLFELLLKRNQTAETCDSPVSNAIREGFNNVANLLLSSIQLNLNQGNVDEILKLLGRSRDKLAEFSKEYEGTLKNLFDSIRDMDVGRLGSILTLDRLTEVPMRHATDYVSSATASELRERVTETAAQIPGLSENLERLYQHKEKVTQTLSTVFESTIKSFMNEVLDTLQTEDSDSD